MADRGEQPSAGWATYTRRQQMTLVVLGLAVVLIFSAPHWYPFSPPAAHPPRADLARQAALFRAALELEDTPAVVENFPFDPNTVSREELLRLGLSEKQAGSWIKYRAGRTDRFKKPDDIARLYVLDSTDVQRLLPLVAMRPGLATAGPAPQRPERDASRQEPERFAFDPNTVSREELVRLGLSPKRAAGFIKYRDKAPPFRSAEDLDKLRLLDAATKRRLKPLVEIAASPPVLADHQSAREEDTPAPRTYGRGGSVAEPQPYRGDDDDDRYELPLASLEVNGATAEEWQLLKGIGPYWSGRIIKLRDRLGGFHSLTQIATVYGLPDSTYQAILPYLTLEQSALRKLPVNLLSVEELAAHPYLNYKLAKVLVNFRKARGPYLKAEDLLKIRILKAEDLERLKPYLDFRQQ